MTFRIAIALLPFLLAADWPHWRGPTGDGISTDTGFPIVWSETKNVRWKIKLTGAGNGSPVIQGQEIILSSTSGRDHSELHLFCYDRDTGTQKWESRFTATPAEAPFSMFPPERGHAASTPVITEKVIYNLFGTGDLIAVDREGKPLWMRSLTKDFGIISNDYGIAASPIVVEGMVIVQIDHLEGSYLLAVDAATGKNKWKTARKEAFDNWATPVAVIIENKPQIVCLGTKKIVGYELNCGKQLWSVEGLERLCSCTPIVRSNKLYAVSGPGGATLCLDLSVTPTPKMLWQSKKNGPFVPSPIVVGDYYFMTDDQGNGSCLDLATGKELWKERLGQGRMRPSPVSAEGRIYFTALDGTTTVISATGQFQELAKNKLGEDVAASLAMSKGQIFIRSDKHLWCIQEGK